MELFGRILIALFFATGASAQLPSQDILALLAFKKGITHDPTGYISKSWNEEAINFNGCPSSWNGIVCDGTSIAGVVIDNLGLTGTMDLSVLANLTMLIKLSLSGNNFTGRLPDNVANFVRLKHLDLSDNLFSGVLPGDIGRLRSLQNLTLAWNNFSGPLPPSIGRLASMLSLDFSHNLFSGPLPSTLKDLKNLVSLNFSNNVLEGKIPTRLDEIPTLQSLDLSWNQFDGAVDWYFLMQSTAVYVDLSGNLLSSAGPKELKYLSEVSETVKYLNLSNNRLTGSLIDATEVSTFGSLRMLDLSSNQLSGELPRFDYVYELEVLKLRNNGISGAVPDALLKGDSLVLNELDLSANNLSGHIGLITSATLQTLNLSSNAISGGLPLLTGSCVVLDLSKNQFAGNLSVIEKWGNDIEYIDLSQNQLMGPIPGITSEFLRLNYLNLSHNVLMGTLPQVLVQYPKLNVLDISFNKFTGPILIDLLTSPTLQELYIQYNILEGSIMFPPLTKKSNLQILNLSGNRFNGSFPDDLVSLTGLQILDMSVNNFTGPLPPSIAELTSLISLDMSLNHFTGPLPATLSDTLVAFNASYNDLSGVVPANLRKFPDSSFHPGNIMLEFPSLSPVSANAPFGGPSQKSNKVFIHATIIAAGIIVVVFLTLLCIFLHYKRMSSSHSERVIDRKTQRCIPGATGVKGRDRDGTIVVSADDLIALRKGSSDVISPEEKMGAVAGFSPSKGSCFSWSPESGETCPRDLGRFDVRSPDRLAGDLYFLDETITLSPEELARAPAEVLGRSSHGTSYRATLDNGVFLTVKWLREGVAKPKKEFSKEAKKFANIRHPNVVGLRGYYWGPTAHEKLILSDYITPGNVANVLYDRPERKALPLNWAQRLKIAVDVARGLNYLHFDRAIPHGNLKATNILLDGLDLNARVADYCLHRLMTQSGTVEQIHDLELLGYCAPELAASKKTVPSFKSDVYAFGVVLLELLTGRCAADQISGEEGEAHMTDWIRMRVAESHETDCFDPAMAPDIVNPAAAKGMKEMMEIAMRCIRPLSERPGIKSVYEDLSSI